MENVYLVFIFISIESTKMAEDAIKSIRKAN